MGYAKFVAGFDMAVVSSDGRTLSEFERYIYLYVTAGFFRSCPLTSTSSECSLLWYLKNTYDV